MSYTVAAVDKALEVLELIAELPDLGVTELAQHTGSTKSQVFRLLHTLEGRGFVRKDPLSKRYVLGYRTLYVGDKAKRQMNLIRLIQPYLDELAELSRENVHLVVREGVKSVCVALSESPQPLRLYAQVGRRGPLHAGGASKVLLAHAPPEVCDAVFSSDLEVFTSTTVTSKQQLSSILDTIRRTDVYQCQNDLDEGAFSIAAPIRDHSGTVVAAISIAGPVSRLNEETIAYHHEILKDYSQRGSRALGWKPAFTNNSSF